MNLATICPTHLLDVVEYEPLHMALAQYLHDDKEYREWYRRMGYHGAFIIVDNGAAEGVEMPFKDVVNVADYVYASEIILPDKLRQGEWSFHAHMQYMNYIPPWTRMFVPHGLNWNEWYHYAISLIHLDCGSIGIPKYIEGFEGGRGHAIEFLREQMSKRNSWHPLHLLGVYRHPKAEVYYGPEIRSVDTGAPIAWAQHDVKIDDYKSMHLSLDWEHSADRDLCYHNINKMKEWCHAC